MSLKPAAIWSLISPRSGILNPSFDREVSTGREPGHPLGGKVFTVRKALCMLATVGLMSIIGLAGAGALDYPATTGSLTVSPRSVDPGGTVTVSGSGFMPGAMVPIIITSTPTLLATVSAGGAGSFSTTMTIPASIGPGVHTMSATGASPDGGTLTLSTTLTMNGSSLLGLAFTGVNTAALAGVAAAAIAVGALFVGVTRRRSTLKA